MPTNQLILIGCGILFAALTIKHAIGGRRTAYWGGVVSRESSPRAFWFTIALDACIAIAVLSYAILAGAR
jgi:hypothetical protein